MVEKLITTLKANKHSLPIWLGQIIAHYPVEWRPVMGHVYAQQRKIMAQYENSSVEQKRQFLFRKMYQLVKYSIENVPFYKEYYDSKNFNLEELKDFDDIEKIPIIDKSVLLEYPIEKRTNMNKNKFLVNTGGSTGQTLTFYVHPDAIGVENAHVTKAWELLGYKHSDMILNIGGMSNTRTGLNYNFARHVLGLDMYKPFCETASALKRTLKRYPCHYVKGYPSVLYEFATFCKTDPELIKILKGQLKGAFLTSEYPYAKYRDEIENTFGICSQSFYGHTERCVVAYEAKQNYLFTPYQTYGFAEALSRNDGHYDLIGTSFCNIASPLIRYNTRDIIDNPTIDGEIMTSFEILEGRSGQFVKDKQGRKISLTGLIMGRHHHLFDSCSHIQIGQTEQGQATIYYVPKSGINIDNPASQFDGSSVDINFSFEELKEPLRTKSGKVMLLVNNLLLTKRNN